MKVTTHTAGPTHTFHPDTKPREVEIELTDTEIVAQQDRSFVNSADTICRIKITRPDGKYSWFAITPGMRNSCPTIEVQHIGPLVEPEVKKRVTGKWREPREPQD